MAIYSITCGSCGLGVAAEIILGDAVPGYVAWLRCPNCDEGSVKLKNGAVYPTAPAGGSVNHLPVDVDTAWREVRTSHAVAAYTASEMMCRKILMHLAVDKAGATPGKKFVDYIDALDAAGYMAPGMKPVVDTVRKRGNVANHELPASGEQESLTTMAVTEHLLRTIYELPGLVPSASTP
jgi:hypothetical protein